MVKPEDLAKIEINNSNVIVYGANLAGVSSEEFEKMISNSLKGKEAKVGRDAIKIVRPAKRDPEAQIIFDDNPVISVKTESIRAMPESVQEEDDEEIKEFRNVELQIRATDLDNFKRGWAAIIPCLSNRRLKLQLAPTIKPEQLTAGASVYGNIDVLFMHSEDGEQIPKLAFVKEIFPSKKSEHIEKEDTNMIHSPTRKIIMRDK